MYHCITAVSAGQAWEQVRASTAFIVTAVTSAVIYSLPGITGATDEMHSRHGLHHEFAYRGEQTWPS